VFSLLSATEGTKKKSWERNNVPQTSATGLVFGGEGMDVNRWLRLIAGTFVLASILLGYYVSAKWFFFTGFVALNLIQSAFTNWCPMMTFLQKLGVKA
jgi:hypothetical protein